MEVGIFWDGSNLGELIFIAPTYPSDSPVIFQLLYAISFVVVVDVRTPHSSKVGRDTDGFYESAEVLFLGFLVFWWRLKDFIFPQIMEDGMIPILSCLLLP